MYRMLICPAVTVYHTMCILICVAIEESVNRMVICPAVTTDDHTMYILRYAVMEE